MHTPQTQATRATPEPLPVNLPNIQPGGGPCMALELAWGGWRRWYLRTFRAGYVRRMAQRRHGDVTGCPAPLFDPRDLKYYRNVCTASWDAADDPFTWRDRLGLARWGLGEVVIMGLPLAVLTLWLAATWWYLAIVPGVVLAWLVSFFRDPRRTIPSEANLVLSPADGVIAEVTPVEHDEFVGGPAVRIGIFLSIFNVHINRAPSRVRVIKMKYEPGLFLNALDPASALKNENLWIGFEEEAAPHRRLVVRQIAGLFARRIVCEARSGEVLEPGHKFGMIKLGSRTEVIVPAAGFEATVAVGQKVQAGSTIVGKYASQEV